MTLSKENLAILQSYGRSFLGAAIALYMAGITDPYMYLNALIAAIAPVAIRYFNKNDIAFGNISGKSTPDQVAAEVTKAIKAATQSPKVKAASAPAAPAKKATKAPAKKSTAKKTSSK
jgi:hypothetical protein